MPTNLAIDDELLKKAVEIGAMPSKKAAVNEALREFIARPPLPTCLRHLPW
jgi:Arc/MetJ family transcription regulator